MIRELSALLERDELPSPCLSSLFSLESSLQTVLCCLFLPEGM